MGSDGKRAGQVLRWEGNVEMTILGNKLVTIAEVAEKLTVSQKTIRRLVGEKKLVAHKVGGQYRFEPEDVKRYLNSTNTAAREVARSGVTVHNSSAFSSSVWGNGV